ncbi:hypothetical protein ACFU7Y_16680 [Kitasatospora sp. NPDC057542]|uniref:hypothetical protein n=1 Tax=Streptomycetaceae TaxID=2062 RepID=UPI001CD023BC|nr:hypothetical protein [Streptomyces sp. LS1784]
MDTADLSIRTIPDVEVGPVVMKTWVTTGAAMNGRGRGGGEPGVAARVDDHCHHWQSAPLTAGSAARGPDW